MTDGEIQFSRLGDAQRAVCSVTCLRAEHAGEQSLAYVFACTSFQEFWLFSCGECSSLIFFTLDRIIPNVCGFSTLEGGSTQTVVAHPACSFRKIA